MTCALVAKAAFEGADSLAQLDGNPTPDMAADLAAKAAALVQRMLLGGSPISDFFNLRFALTFPRALSAWLESQKPHLKEFFCLEAHLWVLVNTLDDFQTPCTTNFNEQIGKIEKAVNYLQPPISELKMDELAQSVGVVAGFMHAFNDIAKGCAFIGSKGFENWKKVSDLTNCSPPA